MLSIILPYFALLNKTKNTSVVVKDRKSDITNSDKWRRQRVTKKDHKKALSDIGYERPRNMLAPKTT